MIQLKTSEVPRSFPRVRWPSLPYFTLASTGYIIQKRPIAIGSETVSSLTRSSAGPMPGHARPRPMPSAIAAKIHSGRIAIDRRELLRNRVGHDHPFVEMSCFTRASMSSRISRTRSRGLPLGSSSGQSSRRVPGTTGHSVAAPHRHEPLRVGRQLGRELLRLGRREVEVFFAHDLDDLGMNALAGLRTGRDGARLRWIRPPIEERRSHLRATRVVHAGEDDGRHLHAPGPRTLSRRSTSFRRTSFLEKDATSAFRCRWQSASGCRASE